MVLLLRQQDTNTTALQVSTSGVVDSPALVGREDVADLVVASALFPSKNETSKNSEPFHYTLGVRWVGNDIDPSPPQGRKADGLSDANACMRRALKALTKTELRDARRKKLVQKTKQQNTMSSSENALVTRLAKKSRRRLKPYGPCVAVPVYLMVWLITRTLGRRILHHIPGGSSVVIPFVQQVTALIATVLSYWLRQAKYMLPWFTRRKQYISF